MKRFTTTLAAGLIAAMPALADDSTSSGDDFREGAEKFGEAFGHFLDGLSKEIEPLSEAWRELIENIPKYEAPEELPNGDIIIRRKDSDGTEI